MTLSLGIVMATQFKYLDKGLSSNGHLSELVLANFNSTYLDLLDKLFFNLHNSKCNGIDVKVKEVHDLLRFEGLVSELQFARYFAVAKQWQVDLLPSNIFGNRRAPDMAVISSKRKYFVEVKNIQFDAEEHNFGILVAALLNKKGLHFQVHIESASIFSTPAYKHQTKSAKEKQMEPALKELSQEIAQISDFTKEITIKTSIADIRLVPSDKGRSFLGLTWTGVISEPEEYAERIVYDLLNKSSKRADWQGLELDIPYLIAIDDPSMFFDEACRYNIEFFGSSTEFYPPLPVPSPTIDENIQNALDLGWRDYLLKMNILRNNRSLIEDQARGKFFTEPELKNATAILVRHNDAFYLLANPFADNRINKPDILEELADCITGW